MSRSGWRREDGLTLIELLVTMVVGTLVVGALTTVTLTGFRSYESADRVERMEQEFESTRLAFLDDVRSATPPARPPTAASITRVELCGPAQPEPPPCPVPSATQAVSGRRLVLGIYDQQLGRFRTVVWEYDTVAKQITRQSTTGNGTPGPARVLVSSSLGTFPAAFTLEADGITVTVAVPLPPYAADGTVSPLRTIRALMRSSTAVLPFVPPTPTPVPTPTPPPAGSTAPTITSTPATVAAVGEAYAYQAQATGTAPIGWALTTPHAGMTIDAGTGLLRWTPSAAGSFTVGISASNGVAPAATQSWNVSVVAPTTVTLQPTAGFDLKSGKTLTPGNLADLLASDDKRLVVDGGYFLSLQFQGIPPAATVLSVKAFIRHYEEPDVGLNPIAWEVGGGALANPSILLNRIAPILVGKAKEGTQDWDVTSAITTAARVNDLKLVIRNTDGKDEKTFINHVYLVVTYR